jgi:serine/threonine protein kinase
MITEVFIAIDDDEVYRASLPPGEYVIGRDETAHIRIDHPTVSRRHARLIVEEEQVAIADLESGNGTSIDEVPLSGESNLYEGQTARLGEVRLRARLRVMREALPPSSRFYRKGNVVAMGGMGAIHEARQAAMGRKVAMKVMLRDESESGLRRFINEARITGMLEHPNIVPVHELGVDPEGRAFYTMKFVNGTTLAEVLAGLYVGTPEAVKKYPLSFLLTVFQKVCDAIAFAHSRGVHHRDLKPENIMIGDFGEVLVMDWGLSKETGFASEAEDVAMSAAITSDGELRTLDGSVLGTPTYMAPEQARGEIAAVDERSDIYALGVILHEILYLQAPVSGENMNEVVQKVATGIFDAMPDRPRPHLPGGRIPVSLDAVRRKALAFEPARRYQRVQDLQADLSAYQSGFATSAEGAGFGKHLLLLVKRNKGVAASVGGALVALVGLSTWFTAHLIKERNHSREQERMAQAQLADRIAADEARAKAEQDAQTERLKAQEADTGRMAALAEADEMKTSAEERRRLLEERDRNMAVAAAQIAERSRSHLLDGQPKEALDSITQAVSLASSNPDYVLTRANLLQSSGRFGESREAYRRALDLGADRGTAGTNLELSTELERVQAGQVTPKPQVVERLSAALHAQKRGPEIVMLDAAVEGRLAEPTTLLDEILADGSVAPALQPLLRDLGEYTAQPDWNRERLFLRPDGTIGLNLSGLVIGRLSMLRGHDVAELDLTDADVPKLEDLRGLSLRRLNLHGSAVADLGALAGMPLEELACGKETSDLEPLRGMPLKSLDLAGTRVANLDGVSGMPLEELRLDGLEISDLEPLRGLPLKRLHLNVTGATDFSPVASLSDLEFLDLPPQAADFDISVLPALQQVVPRHLGMSQPIEAAKLQEIVAARQQLWARHGRVLELMQVDDMGPHRLTVRDTSGEFELDLRGTGASDLKALRSMPVQRLFVDTAGEKALDLAHLRDHPTIRHLIAVGANIADVSPLASLPQLESVALSPDVQNVNTLNAHASLRKIGYQLDHTGVSPRATAEEFFGPLVEKGQATSAGEPTLEFLFDNAADGAQGWSVRSGEEFAPRGFWVADPASEGGRGGGLFAFYERKGDSKLASFVFSPLLARPQRSGLYGGLLEFELRMHEMEVGSTPREVSVTLVGSGGRSISYEVPVRLSTMWSVVPVPLDISVPWTDRATLYRAREEDMKSVISSLKEVIIQAEFTTGLPNERTDIDNVRLWDSASAAQRSQELRDAER